MYTTGSCFVKLLPRNSIRWARIPLLKERPGLAEFSQSALSIRGMHLVSFLQWRLHAEHQSASFPTQAAVGCSGGVSQSQVEPQRVHVPVARTPPSSALPARDPFPDRGTVPALPASSTSPRSDAVPLLQSPSDVLVAGAPSRSTADMTLGMQAPVRHRYVRPLVIGIRPLQVVIDISTYSSGVIPA